MLNDLHFQLQQLSYESCKPLSAWVTDLEHRVEFFIHWVDQVTSSVDKLLKPVQQLQQQQGANNSQPEVKDITKVQPRSFWLPAFFFPQG